MNGNQTEITRNLLFFCYTCDHANNCATEQECIDCWTEQNLITEVDETEETQRLMRLYWEQ
jgi:hypothetical protein